MADLQVLRGTSVTVTETFSMDGAPQDLDTGVPTVVATAPDGTTTTPTASGVWTGRTTGQYRVVLAAQPEVTYRNLAWTGAIGGQPQTLYSRVEWIGAYLFNESTLRALRVGSGTPFTDEVTYPAKDVQRARAEVLDDFATYLGFSPVPRFAREVHSSRNSTITVYQRVECRLLAVTVNGVVGTIANYTLTDDGHLLPTSNYLYGTPITRGVANVAVEYQHGWTRVKGKGGHMALLTAAARLNPAAYSSASTVSLPGGETYTYEPSEVGRAGFVRFTGIRDVDRWLNQHRMVGAFA
jgi:hypothetical protein